MAEIVNNQQQNKLFYRISGKEKAILKYVKGEPDVKLSGLRGYLEDIVLLKDKAPNEEPHFEWQFILTDSPEPTADEVRMVVRVKEGSYLAERICNLFLGIQQPGEIEISVYASTKIKNSPGVSMKVDGKKIEFGLGEWDELNGGYKGVPKGEPKNRIDFWREKLFQNVYQNLLGQNWSGEIQLGYALKQQETAARGEVKEEYSEEILIAVSKIINGAKLKSYAQLKVSWPDMVRHFNANVKKPMDNEKFGAMKLEVQQILDSKMAEGDDNLKLENDGTVVVDDLPF